MMCPLLVGNIRLAKDTLALYETRRSPFVNVVTGGEEKNRP